MKTQRSEKPKTPLVPGQEEIWNLRLYATGQTGKSSIAFANLKKLCEKHLARRYKVEVVDLLQTPKRAKQDQIVIIPTLLKKFRNHRKPFMGTFQMLKRS